MASVTAVTAAPTTIAPGGTSTLTPTIVDPSSTFTGTVYDDQGGSASVSVTIAAEGLTFTTNSANKGLPGFIYAALSAGAAASIAVAANGTSFIVTANPA